MSDSIVQAIRYILMIVGGIGVGKGYFTSADLATAITDILNWVSAGLIAVPFVWGMYVKWKTKSVPVAHVDANPAIPTVSTVTGTVS